MATESNDLYSRFTVYTGADDQLPDPDYEVAVGSANALAYIGSGTVFIKGLQLGNSGQIGNWTFEVISAGAVDDNGQTVADVSTVFAEFDQPNPIAYYQGAVYRDSAWFSYNTGAGSDVITYLKSKNYGAFKFKRNVTLNSRTTFSVPVWVQTNASPRQVYCSFTTAVISGGFNIDVVDPQTGIITPLLGYIPPSDPDIYRPRHRCVAYDEVRDVYGKVRHREQRTDPNTPIIITGAGSTAYTVCASISGLYSLAAWDGHIYALAYSSSHWRVRRYDYTGTYVDEVEDTADNFSYGVANEYCAWIRVDTDGQALAFNSFTGRLWKITTIFEEVSTAVDVNNYNSDQLDGVFYCTESFASFGFDDQLIGAGPLESFEYSIRKFKAKSISTSSVKGAVDRLLLLLQLCLQVSLTRQTLPQSRTRFGECLFLRE